MPPTNTPAPAPKASPEPLGEAERSLIQRAAIFASEAHRDQKRKYNGRPYIEHPMRVAHAALLLEMSDTAIAAAWLHDVVEDCGVASSYLTDKFGHDVAALVFELTNPSKGSKAPRSVRKKMDRDHIAKASREAKLLKLLDRLDNISEMAGCDPDFWKVYSGETWQLCEAVWSDDDKLIRETIGHLRLFIMEQNAKAFAATDRREPGEGSE